MEIQISLPVKITSQIIKTKSKRQIPWISKISKENVVTIQSEGVFRFDEDKPIFARQAMPGVTYQTGGVYWKDFTIVGIKQAPELDVTDKTLWIWSKDVQQVMQFDKDIVEILSDEMLHVLHKDASISTCKKDGNQLAFLSHLPANSFGEYVKGWIGESLVLVVKHEKDYHVRKLALPDLDSGFEIPLKLDLEPKYWSCSPQGTKLAVSDGQNITLYDLPTSTTHAHTHLTPIHSISLQNNHIQFISEHHVAIFLSKHLTIYETRFYTVQHESQLDIGPDGDDELHSCLIDSPENGTQLALVRSIVTKGHDISANTLAYLIPFYCPSNVSLISVLGKNKDASTVGTTTAEANVLSQLNSKDFEKSFFNFAEKTESLTHSFVNAVVQTSLHEHWSRKVLLHLLRTNLVSASAQGGSDDALIPSLVMSTTLSKNDVQVLEGLIRHVTDLKEEDLTSAIAWTLAMDSNENWKSSQQRKTELKHHYGTGKDVAGLTHGQSVMLQTIFSYPVTESLMSSAMRRILNHQQVEELFKWAVELIQDETLDQGTWIMGKEKNGIVSLTMDQSVDVLNLIMDAHLSQILSNTALEETVKTLFETISPNVETYRLLDNIRGPLSAFETVKKEKKEKGGKRWQRMVQLYQAGQGDYGIEFIPI